MAKNKKLTETAPVDESGGWLSGFLADEGGFDRRTLWRLGSWGIGSIAAMTIAILAHQSGNGLRKETGASLRQEQIVAANLARQSQQIHSIAKASENEISRISSAVNTLNGDRDRLFARVTVLEQGLDSVTGSISRNAAQNEPPRAPVQTEAALDASSVEPPLLPPPDFAIPAKRLDPLKKFDASNSLSTAMAETAAKPSPADSSSANSLSVNTPSTTAPSANSPATPQAASQPATVARDQPTTTSGGRVDETAAITPATSKPKKDREPHRHENAESKDAQIVVASIPAASDAPQPPSPPIHVPVAHTDFGVDLGSANSIKGLRALWRSVLKSEANELASLHPIIVVKERGNGIGMQLRLVAGPLADAASAAMICAVLSENRRPCETAVFEGQRLATNEDGKESGAVAPIKKPRWPHASSRHRHGERSARAEEPTPPPQPTPPPSQPSASGSFFSH
jgi:hypothetical protein